MAKIVADFEGVESGGGAGGARVPEGDYRAKVAEVKTGESKSSGNTMLIWRYEITEGKYKGKKLKPDYTVISKDALWRLKSLLEALGVKVPNGKVDLTPIVKGAKGKELGITVTDDEYDGKMQSRVSDYLSIEDLESTEADEGDDTDDKEEASTKTKTKGKKKEKKKGKKKEESDDDDDEVEDLDLEGL